jgi:hypothetical protein
MRGPGETGLLLRVLSDAEWRAADGCFREAVVLLRWAARIVTRERLPLVLLAYHRILDIERASAAQERVELRSQTIPLPQFPQVAPAVERNAFVPAQEGAQGARTGSVANIPAQARRTAHRVRWTALVSVCGALAVMLQVDGLSSVRWGTPTRGPSEAEPREAPGLLLTSARENLVSGDSIGARAHLRRVLEDPRTSGAEYAEAARMLIELSPASAP